MHICEHSRVKKKKKEKTKIKGCITVCEIKWTGHKSHLFSLGVEVTE